MPGTPSRSANGIYLCTARYVQVKSVYMLTLTRSPVVTLSYRADQLISGLLAWIGDLNFKKIQICMQSGQAEFDLRESVC